MKITIQAAPGELETRSDDLRKVVDRLVDRMVKGSAPKSVSGQIDQNARTLDYAALQGTVDRSAKHVDRIRRVMQRRIAEVLREDDR